MRVAITGGSGYIGTHTALKLLDNGHEVLILDVIAPHESIEPFVDYKFVNFVDRFQNDILKGVDAVIHLASYKSVNESNEFPISYYWNNINSLTNVLRAMDINHIENIVFASSCSVYGDGWWHAANERDYPENQVSVYAHTKDICEEILRNCGLNVVNFRYFNPIGTKVKIDSGNVLEYMVKASKNKSEFHVYGTDYNTIDGTCVRDYLHIDDLADANVLACEAMLKGFNTINIGSGIGTSVFQLIEKFVEKYPLLIGESKPRQPGNIAQIYADISKAKELLGWEPKLTLQNAIDDAYENG